MARSRTRLLLWLLVLCMPLQGFGVAWARLSGALHFHAAVHDHFVDHEHDADHHHASAERHHHDAEDDSVVVLDDDGGRALSELPSVASTRVLDVETMPHVVPDATRLDAPAISARSPAIHFRSFIAEPPERRPR